MLGFRVSRVQGLGLWILGFSGFGVSGVEFKVYGSGGSGFLGLRILGCLRASG